MSKDWDKKHPEKGRASSRKWRAAHPNYHRDYYKAHKEELLEQQRVYHAEHRQERASYNNEYHRTHKKERRTYRLKVDYGLSHSDFDNLFASQNGRCAICGRAPKMNEVFNVDHDHTTNQVRGILCRGCNHMIGNALDNQDILKRAIEYLSSWSVKRASSIELKERLRDGSVA